MYCAVGMKKVVEGRDHQSTATNSSNNSLMKEKSNSSKSKRFEMKWSVDVDPGWLPDNKKT